MRLHCVMLCRIAPSYSGRTRTNTHTHTSAQMKAQHRRKVANETALHRTKETSSRLTGDFVSQQANERTNEQEPAHRVSMGKFKRRPEAHKQSYLLWQNYDDKRKQREQSASFIVEKLHTACELTTKAVQCSAVQCRGEP